VGRQVELAVRSSLSAAHGNCPACDRGLLLLLQLVTSASFTYTDDKVTGTARGKEKA